ncbi:MAG: polysaccharide biosynthesis protein [Lapillicoccus sp.]
MTAPAGSRSVLRRLTGFTVLPLLSLVTPFLLMPVVARVAGPPGWSSFVAGQAVGTVGATVVFWGWNVGGPVLVAQASSAVERAEVYAASLRTRYLLLLGVVPVAAAVSAVVAQPGHRVDASAMAAATSLLGMSPSWFGIGAGEPWWLFWYDTLPRVVAAVVGAGVVRATGLVWTYPVLLAASVVVSLMAFRRRVAPDAVGVSPFPVSRSAGELRDHLGTAGINLAATAYASTPVPVATVAFRPEVSSPFASADAAYRLGLFSVTAMGNAFQGWTLEGVAGAERRSRHRSAFVAHLGLGVVGGLLFAALGPWVTGFVFGADVAAPRDVCVWYGLAFVFLSLSTPPIRNLLVPAGRVRLVLGWTLGSAVVGLALMVAAAVAGWSAGVAAGMAVSEAVLFAGLLAPALREVQAASP